MNEQLIEIKTQDLNGVEVQTCNARDLWQFVDSKQDFSTWIKNRIEKYGFVEGEDFTVHKFMDSGSRGQYTIDYHLTLDAGKEIAMVENNEKGRQVRRYFIECETRLKVGEAIKSLPSPTQDRVAAILMIGQAMAKVPGVKAGIVAAATLTCISDNTGIATEAIRRSLPAANTPICSLNATQLGREIGGVSARSVNCMLADRGLQVLNDRMEWELTDAGQKWAKALPYSRNGHSGYQLLWNPSVADLLVQEAA